MTRTTAIKVRQLLAALVLLSVNAWGADFELSPGAVFRDCRDCPEMVVIPPGSFQMGNDGGEEERYEGPVRDVTIDYTFAAGRFEVTNEEFARFVNATGYARSMTTGCNSVREGKPGTRADLNWRNPGYAAEPDHPVTCVAWYDAESYARWLSRETGRAYRLLSEAEWEYLAIAGPAARAVNEERKMDICEFANVYDRSGAKTPNQRPFVDAVPCDDGFGHAAPVGRFPPNEFGLHDVVGNVWEWVEDCYIMPLTPTPVDGTPQIAAGCDRRAVKGGSWGSAFSRQRPQFRGRDPESLVTQVFGFRIARDLTPSLPRP